MKTEILKFNEQYNIIKICKTNIVEFYLEKIGYGDLRYIVGVEYDIELFDEMVLKCIELAEYDKFWGEE